MAYATTQPRFPSYGQGEKIDHRRRKRNRIRASCLNCYASKRKCDKKRPCTRCVRLGSTSLCVYETDEPLQIDHGHNFDEVRQLRRRIVELEGVICQFKKKPHSKRLTNGEFNKSTHPRLWDQENATGTNGTLGTMSAAPTKMESFDHTPLEYKPVYDSGQYAPPAEEMDVINHPSTTAHSSPLCSSCSDASYYQQFPNEKHSMHTINDVRASESIEKRGSSDLETSTLSTNSCYSSPHTYPLPMEYNSPALLYPAPPPLTTDIICQCVRCPSAFGPLVNLGVSLRSAKEALEVLHTSEHPCGLFSYIAFLENHIFSMTPQERQTNTTPEATDFARAHMRYTDTMETEIPDSSG